ncbi:MAG: glycosyltransferase [Opitutaceae bacterium]|nr:glycosyltransferase [Opitutaceae bacterium]
MKIFHVVATSQEWGGLERSVVDLAAAQANAGHEVVLAASAIVLDRVAPGVRKLELSLAQNRRDPRLLWSVLRAIRAFRPEVVHAHANKAASLIKTLRPFLPPCARVATVQNTKRSVRVFRGFDQVIAVSARAGAALGDIPHTVIWNAIPRSAPVTTPPATPVPFRDGPRPVLAAVGRLVEAKGFDILLAALREVDASLWIIGEGPLRADLEARAAALGVADRVWFAGFRRDVGALNALADLMVVSSRHEGFPFAFIEMLHQRRPVVGTRVAGVEEVLPEEWLCPLEDAPALAALIRKALALDPAARLHAFEPVFARARDELALESTLPRIHALYSVALRSRGLAG